MRFTSNGRCQRYAASPFSLLGNKSAKPRVRAEPDEPKALYASDCSTPNIFLMDSSHSIILVEVTLHIEVGDVVHNPISIIIPCHRVVGADGSLTGYAGGLDKKIKLLKLEKAL